MRRLLLIVALAAAMESCGPAGGEPEGRGDLSRSLTAPNRPVSSDRVGRLRLGMTVAEVERTLSPAQPTPLSVPVLIYDGVNGCRYYLVFYDMSASPADQEQTLRQVVVFPDAKATRGRYLLPEARRGQMFEVPQPGS